MAETRPRNRNWTRAETLLAFRLYCYTPFGKLHTGNPDIIALAQRLGRSPGAVGMKACNFASLDPLHQARGVKGLSNRSQIEEQIWEEFAADSESIADEAEQTHETFATANNEDSTQPASADTTIPDIPEGPTEQTRSVRTRRVQRFFRHAVLSSYRHRCALTGLAVPELLNASHIIPWAAPGPSPDGESQRHRADPSNGLCLNALHDRAFDRGLITFDPDHALLLSPRLRGDDATLGRLLSTLRPAERQVLTLPERFTPHSEALDYHRNHVFLSA